jgi:hypothetical protein
VSERNHLLTHSPTTDRNFSASASFWSSIMFGST